MSDELNLFGFDIETGGVNKKASPEITANNFSGFAQASLQNFEQSPYYLQHFEASGKPYQLLELYTQGLGHRSLLNRRALRGYRPGTSLFLRPQPGFALSDFAFSHGIYNRSTSAAALPISEELAIGSFYRGLKRQIGVAGRVDLLGWNGVFDLSNFERATHQYGSLRKYQGFFAKQSQRGKFRYIAGEDPFLQAAFRYGQENPEFAQRFYRMRGSGRVAQSWEEMRQVPGWSLENVAGAFGGMRSLVGPNLYGLAAHTASVDTEATAQIYSAFSLLNTQQGTLAEGFGTVGALFENRTPDEIFHKIYGSSSYVRRLEQETQLGAKLLSQAQSVERSLTVAEQWHKPLIGWGIFAGTAIALGLAAGKRKDRQTQIEALRHAGLAGASRRQNTDFGSGWRGLNEDSSNNRSYATVFGVAGLYAAHRWSLNHVAGYAARNYAFWREVEDRSPNSVFRTLGTSQRASAYLPGRLVLRQDHLFANFNPASSRFSRRTRLGEHLERLSPGLDLHAEFLENPHAKFIFERNEAGLASPYLQLSINGKKTKHSFSFVEGRGALGRASEHYGAPLGIPLARDNEAFEHGVEWLTASGEKKYFVPYLARTEGQTIRNLGSQISRETFGYADRLNRSFHEIDAVFHRIPGLHNLRLSLPAESYNGTLNLVGRLLTRRVAPIAAGLVLARYADYKLGHRPTQFAWDLYAKARIFHAELTDRIPGARGTTDWYAQHVPGRQYAPLALPLLGGMVGGLAHYSQVLAGTVDAAKRASQFTRYARLGVLAGSVLALPFLPGMLGSRKTAGELRSEFSGETPVAVRSGRWWQFGTSALEGNRILMYRPHQYVLAKTRAADISLYGSEQDKWTHNPLIHPLTWFKDPNWLARKHEADRPYPMTSPAFSNVPWIGPALAATIGKLAAPPRRMHEAEWDGTDYTLYTKAVEPKSPRALNPEYPHDEFSLHQVAHRGEEAIEEAIGLPGFLLRSGKKKMLKPGDGKPDVVFEGTRQMTSWSRRFSELELGGLPFLHPDAGITSYTEPVRRTLQHEKGTPPANEIPNQMPSWLPNGDEYFFDFHKGDVYSRIPYGSVRLPGAGYEALHPEVAGLDPEEYPDLNKLAILGDVAPWSLRFKQLSAKTGAETRASGDLSKRIEYEQIMDRAREMKESTVRYSERHTGPTEEIEGTVRFANGKEIQLEEFRGRYFRYSGVGGSAADLSAFSLGKLNREQAAEDVRTRQAGRAEYLADTLAPGTKVRLVLPRGGSDVQRPRAVVFAGSTNVNRELIERGYARLDPENAGAELQAMDGTLGKLMRRYAEGVAFEGNQGVLNPLRYLPSSMHSKLWNERTALDAYINQEVSGTRMRRWQRPIHDFAAPYLQGAARRLTGNVLVSPETLEKRDLDTLADQLEYLRAVYGMSGDPENRNQHFLASQRTSIGANLFGETDRLPQTLPGRERKFFQEFLGETDPDQRARILGVVSKEMQDTLLSQWTKQANTIRKAAGTSVEDFDFSGRYVAQEDIDRVTDLAGKVSRVIDGDSIVVDTPEGRREVRLANVNTPEMTTYSGHVAKQMTEKLALGKHVRLHVVGEDKYHRTVADVFTDDKRILNYELLNSGHAAKDVYENQDGSKQGLSVGDFFRAREIAEFFGRRGLKLPDASSEAMADDIDYEDVKVKIVQWAGLDFHDFGIFDDRVSMLWRKPYLDGAVRELTSGDDRSVEETTMAIEQAIAQSKANDRGAQARVQSVRSRKAKNNVRVNVSIQPDGELKRDVRRNREEYEPEPS